MAGLKGLKKKDRSDSTDKAADEFIKGASERAKIHEKPKKKKVFERYTFSLNPDVSDSIDKLTLIPREFRVNRSDVIKAAINTLNALPEEEIVKILMKVKQVT